MSEASNTPVPARMILTGLLAERPETASALADRVEQEFSTARFSRSIVYKSVKRLRADGLICVIEGDEARRVQRLRPTEQGLKQLDDWMHRQLKVPTELRDPILTRLCLCREVSHVRAMIDSIELEAQACDRAQAEARSRLIAAQHLAAQLDSTPSAPGMLSDRARAEVNCLVLAGETGFWTNRTLSMRKLRRALQEKLDQLAGAGEEEQSEP